MSSILILLVIRRSRKMGKLKKQEKSLFNYTVSEGELEDFLNFLDNLQKEFKKNTTKSKKIYSKKKTKKRIKNKKELDFKIQELPFEDFK